MSLKTKKYNQKGGLLEDILPQFEIYNGIYNDLIKYDKNVDLNNIQVTESKLLAIHLLKLKNLPITGNVLQSSVDSGSVVQEYIDSLHQKFLELIVPKTTIKIPKPRKSSVYDDISIENTIYTVNKFEEYYTLDSLEKISLSNNLYIQTDKKFNIVNLNTDIIRLGNTYIKQFYLYDKFDIFLLRLSKKLKNFTCTQTQSYDAKKIFIIHYLNLRLISILNKYLILYVEIPRLFFNLYMWSGNCFDTPLSSILKGRTIGESETDKKRLIISSNIIEILNLYSQMMVSKNEGDVFINSLANLDEKTILSRLTNYPALKAIATLEVALTGILGAAPILLPIFGFSTAITEYLLTDEVEDKISNMAITKNSIDNFFTTANVSEAIKTRIIDVKKNDNKYDKNPDECSVDYNLKSITNMIDGHKKISFEYYDSIKFYCYIFETIITWQCNTTELTQEGNIKKTSTTNNVSQDTPLPIDTEWEKVKEDLQNVTNGQYNSLDPPVQQAINNMRTYIAKNFNLSVSACNFPVKDKKTINSIRDFANENDKDVVKNSLCGKNTTTIDNTTRDNTNTGGKRKSRKLRKRKTQRRRHQTKRRR